MFYGIFYRLSTLFYNIAYNKKFSSRSASCFISLQYLKNTLNSVSCHNKYLTVAKQMCDYLVDYELKKAVGWTDNIRISIVHNEGLGGMLILTHFTNPFSQARIPYSHIPYPTKL